MPSSHSSLLFSHSVVSNSLPPHGLPVLHYLLEFAQTHVQWVGDAIQPFHPLLPSSSCPQSFFGLFIILCVKNSGKIQQAAHLWFTRHQLVRQLGLEGPFPRWCLHTHVVPKGSLIFLSLHMASHPLKPIPVAWASQSSSLGVLIILLWKLVFEEKGNRSTQPVHHLELAPYHMTS